MFRIRCVWCRVRFVLLLCVWKLIVVYAGVVDLRRKCLHSSKQQPRAAAQRR